MTKRTKREIKFKCGNMVHTVPTGSPVEPIKGEPGKYWVIPSAFPRNTIAHHDATYYGCRVDETDVG